MIAAGSQTAPDPTRAPKTEAKPSQALPEPEPEPEKPVQSDQPVPGSKSGPQAMRLLNKYDNALDVASNQ